jgi:hypothetical protein
MPTEIWAWKWNHTYNEQHFQKIDCSCHFDHLAGVIYNGATFSICNNSFYQTGQTGTSNPGRDKTYAGAV